MVSTRNNKGNQKYLELVESENTTNQNLWNKAKSMFRGNFMALNILIQKKKV